jgi:FtsZ-interacting cell division protein ZipA
MIEIIALLIINICLIAFLVYSHYSNAKERKELIRSIMAKNLPELTDNEMVEKFKPEPEKKENIDLVPVSSLSDNDFDKMIKKQLEQAQSK